MVIFTCNDSCLVHETKLITKGLDLQSKKTVTHHTSKNSLKLSKILLE